MEFDQLVEEREGIKVHLHGERHTHDVVLRAVSHQADVCVPGDGARGRRPGSKLVPHGGRMSTEALNVTTPDSDIVDGPWWVTRHFILLQEKAALVQQATPTKRSPYTKGYRVGPTESKRHPHQYFRPTKSRHHTQRGRIASKALKNTGTYNLVLELE